MIKRLFDVLVSATLLILCFPLILVSAVVILVSLGRPVLFRQERPGYRGKPFMLYKLRTMHEALDAKGDPLPDSARLTRVGQILRRTSLDELPQLFNVLKGDMSLVGPRPLLMEYLPLYSANQMRRHEVRPGITGWAQVNGRNALHWEERFLLDVWYVDNQTFWLDLKILAMTLHKVLARDGISKAGESTMSKFTGSQES